MPNFAAWLGTGAPGLRPSDQIAERAAAAWRRIQDNPIDVVIDREGNDLSAQTFRLEMKSSQDTQRREAMVNAIAQPSGILFGVKDHPDPAVLDSDVKVGDRFEYESHLYDVIAVYPYPGEIQAQVQRS